MPESLKEWKVAIMSVRQEYESTEGCYDYKISTGITYRGLGQPMDIRKSNDNFKTESLSASTITSMDTWQRSTEQKRKNERPEHVLNVTKKDISPKIAKGSR